MDKIKKQAKNERLNVIGKLDKIKKMDKIKKKNGQLKVGQN